MKIIITNSDNKAWYKDSIGSKFDVISENKRSYFVKSDETGNIEAPVLKKDAEMIEE